MSYLPDIDETLHECSACMGTGLGRADGIPCCWCRGTGMIDDRPARDGYDIPDHEPVTYGFGALRMTVGNGGIKMELK